MGYPAFHTRLKQGAEWARCYEGRGNHWLWIFFVSSKHLSRLWLVLSPLKQPTLFYSTAQEIVLDSYFAKAVHSKLCSGCHAKCLLLKSASQSQSYKSSAVWWCFTAVYGITNQDVSRGVLDTASLRTTKQNEAWKDVPQRSWITGREKMAVRTVESISKLNGKQRGTASWLHVLSETFGSEKCLVCSVKRKR